MDIKRLIEDSWDRLSLHTLTTEQIEELKRNPTVVIQEGFLPGRFRFPEHSHPTPQMLLVTRGELTHVSGKTAFTQHPGDVLIVPARLKHTAYVRAEPLEFLLILKASS